MLGQGFHVSGRLFPMAVGLAPASGIALVRCRWRIERVGGCCQSRFPNAVQINLLRKFTLKAKFYCFCEWIFALAQLLLQEQCTRIRTSDFECTEAGNQSYIGSRRRKCVLLRRRRISDRNNMSAMVSTSPRRSSTLGLSNSPGPRRESLLGSY